MRTNIVLFLLFFPICAMADHLSDCVLHFNTPRNFKAEAKFYGMGNDFTSAADQNRVVEYCECAIAVISNDKPLDTQAKLLCASKSRMFETRDF